MPLVEIIRGAETGDAAVALALDYVQAIGKTPIVVNDGRGFFTSRVFATYVMEGVALLKEGVAPALIENAGKIAGFPVGPLEVVDNTSLGLSLAIRRQWKKDLGEDYAGHPADDVFELFVETLDRPGRKAGRGFYDWPEGGPQTPVAGDRPPFPARRRTAGRRRRSSSASSISSRSRPCAAAKKAW